jgi:hypothetical protein
MIAKEINCSTECSLGGTPRATLRGYWKMARPVRIRLPGGSTVQYTVMTRLPRRAVQYRSSTEQENQCKNEGVQSKE